MTRILCRQLLPFALGWATMAAHAAELDDMLDTTVSLRTAVWSGSRRLDDETSVATGSAWGRAKLTTDTFGTFLADGWVGRASDGSMASRARELYWTYRYRAVQLKVGRQLAIWGRADGINPTDNLTPHDYTLLTPDDGDQRYGRGAVQVALATDLGRVLAWWFPDSVSNTVPLPKLPGVRYRAPEGSKAQQWAVKLELGNQSVDGSISYFHGDDLMPDLVLATINGAGVAIAQRNPPVEVLGADISLASDSIVWRAEAGYSHTDSLGTDDFTHKKPQLRFVGGPEFSLGNATTFGIQGIWQKVNGFASPDRIPVPLLQTLAWQQAALSNQTSGKQAGMTWRLASRWLNDTLTAETSGAFIHTDRSGIWRAKLSYALDDHWSVQAGADRYFGPSHSFYGQLFLNRVAYVQLRYSR